MRPVGCRSLLLEVRRTLRPGDPATQKFLDRFGDQLVCVRYRYDAATNLRMTMVELAVDTGLVALTPQQSLARFRKETFRPASRSRRRSFP